MNKWQSIALGRYFQINISDVFNYFQGFEIISLLLFVFICLFTKQKKGGEPFSPFFLFGIQMSLEDNIQKQQQVDEEEIFYTPPSSPILNGQSTSTVSDISKLSFVTLNEAITAKSLSIAIKSETSLSRYYDSRVKARTFEAYVWDYKKVDHLNVREGESYPLFSPEWYALRRREFFKNIMVVSYTRQEI